MGKGGRKVKKAKREVKARPLGSYMVFVRENRAKVLKDNAGEPDSIPEVVLAVLGLPGTHPFVLHRLPVNGVSFSDVFASVRQLKSVRSSSRECYYVSIAIFFVCRG